MIRSDSTLNQLFPLCGHCFLFFAVKQAKQAVQRPGPEEGLPMGGLLCIVPDSLVINVTGEEKRKIQTVLRQGGEMKCATGQFKVHSSHSNSSGAVRTREGQKERKRETTEDQKLQFGLSSAEEGGALKEPLENTGELRVLLYIPSLCGNKTKPEEKWGDRADICWETFFRMKETQILEQVEFF